MSQFLGNASHPDHINLFVLGEVQYVFQVRRRRKGRTEDLILSFREEHHISYHWYAFFKLTRSASIPSFSNFLWKDALDVVLLLVTK
jgi:hypothetical protein